MRKLRKKWVQYKIILLIAPLPSPHLHQLWSLLMLHFMKQSFSYLIPFFLYFSSFSLLFFFSFFLIWTPILCSSVQIFTQSPFLFWKNYWSKFRMKGKVPVPVFWIQCRFLFCSLLPLCLSFSPFSYSLAHSLVYRVFRSLITFMRDPAQTVFSGALSSLFYSSLKRCFLRPR